ncbi:MAG: 5-(carboxyamino)imidazole ribonucleotide synthase [Saprospiraceae bacterium]|nr:5-(carboxyamino)imidazole ribonucleotide synthase [Saprospiraceae bacterium]
MNLDKKIGVLGGGQLGKMLCEAALPWHLKIAVLDKNKDFPSGPYAPEFVSGDFTDYDDVLNFGKDRDVITIEIEKVNTDALRVLESEGVEIYPQPRVTELIQDKGLQKQFYSDHHLPTAEYQLLSSQEIEQKLGKGVIEFPIVQKLRKGGYDGRGVQVVKEAEDMIIGHDSVLEELVDIEKEISVIVARSITGQIVHYEAVEMVFDPKGNLVDHLICPADISSDKEKEAVELAKSVITKLEMTGLLAVEMFLTTSGQILINEVAPRPHNSGHHTIKNCACSQYEQLLRCLIDAPLIPGKSLMPAMMINILGSSEGNGKPVYNGLDEVLSEPGIHMFLYGKKESRPFRKMGHFTITASDRQSLLKKADIVRNKFSISCE